MHAFEGPRSIWIKLRELRRSNKQIAGAWIDYPHDATRPRQQPPLIASLALRQTACSEVVARGVSMATKERAGKPPETRSQYIEPHASVSPTIGPAQPMGELEQALTEIDLIGFTGSCCFRRVSSFLPSFSSVLLSDGGGSDGDGGEDDNRRMC